MIKAVIMGTGGFGLEVLHIMRDIGDYDVIGFLDPRPQKKGSTVDNVPILGNDERLQQLKEEGISDIVVAIADSNIRLRLSQTALKFNYRLPTLIHPRAYVASNVSLGYGTIVYPGAVIMPGCNLAEGILINAGATLGHEVKIQRYSNINPGANIAGKVTIGEQVLVGIGGTILENCSIGDKARVGAGTVVISDVLQGITVVGVPASPIKSP